MVISPCSMPTASCSTFTKGARQLVVQDALETIFVCLFQLLMVYTKDHSGIGAIERMRQQHRFAPALMCASAKSRFLALPVHSSTTSIFKLCQGRLATSVSLNSWIFVCRFSAFFRAAHGRKKAPKGGIKTGEMSQVRASPKSLMAII